MSATLGSMLVGPVSELLGKFITDKDKANQLAHDISTLAEKQSHEQTMGQLEVNREEAKHHSIFVSGWRPAAGWACVSGMAMNYLIIPLVDIGIALAGIETHIQPLDLSMMAPVLGGMLGIGALRSYEKKIGVARES